MSGPRNFFDDLARRLDAADGVGVEYGIRAEPHYSGLTTAELGRVLHNGRRDGSIPARPFFAQAEEDLRVIAPRLLKRAQREIERGKDPRRALDKLADAAREALSRSIDNFTDPPNAPATIRRKGRNDPLVDRGDLIKAVDAVVVYDPGEG